jgi:hypothetical protein
VSRGASRCRALHENYPEPSHEGHRGAPAGSELYRSSLFGLTNSEANHGEDVKGCYFYLDSTPTHSYMKYLYNIRKRRTPTAI